MNGKKTIIASNKFRFSCLMIVVWSFVEFSADL